VRQGQKNVLMESKKLQEIHNQHNLEKLTWKNRGNQEIIRLAQKQIDGEENTLRNVK
jgi:hypothetical protein